MSDSPIFDQVNSEQDYIGTMAETKRLLARYIPFNFLGARSVSQERVVTQDGLAPDKDLDGPLELLENKLKPVGFNGLFSAEESIQDDEDDDEILVRPFVRTEGLVPRGTVPIDRNSTISVGDPIVPVIRKGCTEKCEHESGIRGLLEHVGIDTSRGISVDGRVVAEPFVRVAGVPESILGGRTQEQYWEDVMKTSEGLREDFMTTVVEEMGGPLPWPSVVGGPDRVERVKQHEIPRLEKEFELDELVFNGLTIGEFTLQAIEEFRKKYPYAEGITLSIKPGTDFTKEDHTLIVEGKVPVGSSTAQEALSGILTDFRAAVDQQYPGHIAMAVTGIQELEDGSAILEVEGQSVEIKNYAEIQGRSEE